MTEEAKNEEGLPILRLRSLQVAGMIPMVGRGEAGSVLHTLQIKPNVYGSAFGIGTKGEAFIRKHKGRVAVVLTVDLNYTGLPQITVALQQANLLPDGEFVAKHVEGLVNQKVKRKGRILKPGDK